METAEYETNALLINDISSVIYRIYEPAPSQAQLFPASAPDVEGLLRNGGHIIHYDSIRRAIWHFQVQRKEQPASGETESAGLCGLAESSGWRIVLADEGNFEPSSLLKPRSQASHSANTPTSSSSSSSATDSVARNAPPLSIGASASLTPTDPAGLTAVAEPKAPAGGFRKEAYEFFIYALLGSISSKFCSMFDAIPLNYRSLLLPPNQILVDDDDEVITSPTRTTATFRVYLTTLGALVISVSVAISDGICSLDTISSPMIATTGSQVFAAPLGILATYPGSPDYAMPALDSGLAQTPDTQIVRSYSDTNAPTSKWRLACSRLLQLRGISPSLLNRCHWIGIQIPRRKQSDNRPDGKRTPTVNMSTTISWPSCLCFRQRPVLSPTNLLGDTMLISQGACYDPLASAKTWFLADSERSEKISKRKTERESAVFREPAEIEPPAQQPNAESPLALQRPSNPAAAGAMYPTPPDGVQNQTGVTPSIDGTVSSPSNPAPTAAVVDIDTTMANSSTMTEAYNDVWASGDVKRDRVEEPFLGQGSDVFGDMGADMFGETDITDADFNFFDEQPMEMELDLSGLPDLSDSTVHLTTSPKPISDSKKSPEQHPKAEPDLTIFAKPELRHARSSLLDDKQSRGDIADQSLGIKRQSSPFDPQTVFKRVRASLSQKPVSQNGMRRSPARKGSIFDKVDFDPTLPEVYSKYEQGGRYDFNWKSHNDNLSINAGLPPTTEYLQRHGKQKKLSRPLKELPANTMSLIAKITGGMESSSLHESPAKISDIPSDPDDESLVSDEDDSSYTSDDPLSPTKAGHRRAKLDDDMASQVTSLRDMDYLDEIDPAVALDFPKTRFDQQELAVTKYFADPEPLSLQLSFQDEDLMTVAQILTEQAAAGTLNLRHARSLPAGTHTTDRRRELAALTLSSFDALQLTVPACLGEPTPVNFRALVEVQDVPLAMPPNRLQPRPVPQRDPNVDPSKSTNIYPMPTPHLELRRHDSRFSILPTAIQFWESLGLGPSQGGKDISAICVFPEWEGVSDNANSFLDRMRNIYESYKLGTFERISTSISPSDGLLPYHTDKISTSPNTISARLNPALAEQMESLSNALSKLDINEKNFVVYFFYLPEEPGSIIEACAAFQQLFEVYKRALGDTKQHPTNDLVLQLLPLDFVSSPTSLVMPSTAAYSQLALETYDRCTMFGGQMPSPAIVLEHPTPRAIDFRLSSVPSASLIHENSCIHVAYAQSVDERWVTAAWTDNQGIQQMTASYCLGRKGKPLTSSLGDIAHEIWETTHDVISIWKVHWRVIISKCGTMSQQEIDSWLLLAQMETTASISLTLLTVDTDPSLQLIPPAVRVSPSVLGAFYTTPVSTPQPSIVSPDQSGNNPSTPVRDSNPASATTPGGSGGGGGSAAGGDNAGGAGDPEADSVLLDLTDQTWGAVLSHRLSSSASLFEPSPSLASGYLVKRGGCQAEDPPVVMEVNVVHSDVGQRASPRAYEAVLREVLGYFRGLGALARARGVVDRETDIRPWHIAAAEKGVRAVYLLM